VTGRRVQTPHRPSQKGPTPPCFWRPFLTSSNLLQHSQDSSRRVSKSSGEFRVHSLQSSDCDFPLRPDVSYLYLHVPLRPFSEPPSLLLYKYPLSTSSRISSWSKESYQCRLNTCVARFLLCTACLCVRTQKDKDRSHSIVIGRLGPNRGVETSPIVARGALSSSVARHCRTSGPGSVCFSESDFSAIPKSAHGLLFASSKTRN
jgi:hypothetical protein